MTRLKSKSPAMAARLEWTHDLALLSDPLIMGGLLKMYALTYVLMSSILGVVLIGQGDWEDWLALLPMLLAVVGGLYLLSVLVILLGFRNHLEAHFVLDQQQAFNAMRSPSLERVTPYAFWLSWLIGKPRLGRKLRNAAYQSKSIEWTQVARVRYDPQRSRISLHNRWRLLLMLYCPPARYAEIAAFVAAQQAAADAPARLAQPSPLPRALWRSALIMLACFGPFVLPYPFKLDPFIPIFLLCFGLATVWILSLLGYAVLVGVIWSYGELTYTALRSHALRLPFETQPTAYRGFELLYGDEWLALALCALSLGYLGWDAWRAVRGRNPSMLEGDMLGEN